MPKSIIYPRSPKETMCGWIYLPRFIDKVRLHLANKLDPDYQDNFCKGLDGAWLAAAGLSPEQFIDVVKNTITDGEVADWVAKNVKKSEAEMQAHLKHTLNLGMPENPAMNERLKMRKEQAGFAGRDDIRTFVEFIDADEGR